MAREWTYLADNTSMVGGAPKNRKAIDRYQWGKEALRFCGMQTDEFDKLADKLGFGAAGEVLLLAVARKCEDKPQEWSKTRALGVPWHTNAGHR